MKNLLNANASSLTHKSLRTYWKCIYGTDAMTCRLW